VRSARTALAPRPQRLGQLYIAGAALAWSTAGLLQRELPFGTATQVAGRAFFACPALFAYLAWVERSRTLRSIRDMGWPGMGFAILTAIASSTFIVALNHTSVANVLFLQALAPLAAALLAAVTLRERVSPKTVVAMIVALAGVGVMVGAPDGAHGLGLWLSLVMTLAFAGSVVIARHRREVSMLPAVCVSQVLIVVAYGPFAHPGDVHLRGLGVLLALGVAQMALGLTLLTLGARLISAAEVALIALLEVVLGPLWVWLALGQRPADATLVGGAIVVVAVVVQAVGERAGGGGRRLQRPAAEPGGAQPPAVGDPVILADSR
jgi:drug/metabolite transporter (DMT)-like permease